MKITAIKQQVKKPERVSVFVDEKYSFSLSLDELLKHKIKQGMDVDQADIKRFKKISDDGKLRMRSLEWLLNRPRSTREFQDYLYRKKAEAELTESLIKEFGRRGYLDDQKFGEWFIELQQRRNKSNRAVRAELFKKGLDRELIEELMIGESDDEAERLKALVAKKSKLLRYRQNPQKLAEYLTRQGFSWDLVKASIKSIESES